MNLHPNITRLYIIKIAKWFMLYMPIVVPFYEQNGLSMKDIMILQGIYSVAIVILEIPSGYLADVIGRKKTLIIGALFGSVGFVIYGFSYGFVGFLIAEIILGIGQSCISGADSAMLYDSLLEKKLEKNYTRLEGRITALGNVAEAAAGIIGGLLAIISLRTPYMGQAVVALIAIPAAFTLSEPARSAPLIKSGFVEIVRIAQFAIFKNKILRRNILFSAIIGTATLTMAWLAQPYFEFSGIDLAWFGLLWTSLNITVALTSYHAHTIEKWFGQKRSIMIIALAIPAGYLILSRFSIPLGIIILYIFYLFRGFATPVLKDYINRITASNIRATVLSVRNFIIRLFFALTGPFIGWIKDLYSIQEALLLAGSIFLVLGILTSLLFLSSGGDLNRIIDYKSKTNPS